MPERRLVLASTSVYRRELLARLGIPFIAASPCYDEPRLELPPEKLVMAHAVAKAKSLADDYPESLILGSDQIAALGDEILGKPGSELDAMAQLEKLQGRTHRLLTAIALYDSKAKSTKTALDLHEMVMRSLNSAEIRAYVERDKPVDCAGAYKLESLGISLFSEIRGSDDTAVIGLPLLRVVDLLLESGIKILQE